MPRFATLFRQFILRALWREKIRTAVALVGIALGVAVALSIRLANRSAVDSFRAAVDYVGGDASLRIRGLGGRFDEHLLENLPWLDEFGVVSPVIETYAMLPRRDKGEPAARSPRGRGPLLKVLGVDVLADLALRRYRLLRTSRQQRDPTATEFLRLLTDTDAIVVTQRLAQREGKQIGDPIELVFGSRRWEFRIRGLLLDEGPGRALDGNFAVLDISAAQWVTQRLGQIDHVDVKLKPGLAPAAAEAEMRRRLPADLVVERPDAGLGRTETMIAAFHFNLTALSGIALVVGLFLIYNTASISVAARRAEIGMLQALGAGRARILALFLSEAGLIALVGAGLGVILGTWMAAAAVAATAQTVETFYIAEVASASARNLSPTWYEIGLAVAIAVGLSLVAAAVPAFAAATLRPVEVMRGAERLLGRFRPPVKSVLIAAALAIAAWLLARQGPVGGLPVCGFIAEFLFALSGAFVVPLVLWITCHATRGTAARLLPWLGTECQLAASNLLGALGRVSISVAALAVSLAMMVAISVMVGSFRDTVVYWLGATLRADLMVRPTILTSSVFEARMEPEAAAAIRRDPDVAATGWYHAWQVPYGGTAIRLAATDLANTLGQRLLLFKAPADAEQAVRDAVATDRVLVSESLSLRLGKQPGDKIALPTKTGMREFTIAAVHYDYASNQGTVLVDGRTYGRWFGDDDPAARPSSMAVYLRPGADAETVRARLASTVGRGQDLFFATNANVRREALRVFDSTFAITYALEVIAVVIAALGVVSTLITLIYERQREIAILSLSGAEPRQIRRMVTVEALLIGGVGQLVGILVGMVLAAVLIYVVNVQSFGWTIQFHLPVAFLVQTTLLILAVSATCGLYPAIRAAHIRAIEVVREE
jgi:putative ABC transport system permease protein